MRDTTPKLGDIYTNGINHWVVTVSYDKKCECGKVIGRHVDVNPLLMDENGKPYAIANYGRTKLNTIKPYAKWVETVFT